jgi:hypothetical protein
MMPDPSGIDRVGQEMVKRGPAERGIPGFPAFAGRECFQAPAAALDFREDPARIAYTTLNYPWNWTPLWFPLPGAHRNHSCTTPLGEKAAAVAAYFVNSHFWGAGRRRGRHPYTVEQAPWRIGLWQLIPRRDDCGNVTGAVLKVQTFETALPATIKTGLSPKGVA